MIPLQMLLLILFDAKALQILKAKLYGNQYLSFNRMPGFFDIANNIVMHCLTLSENLDVTASFLFVLMNAH